MLIFDFILIKLGNFNLQKITNQVGQRCPQSTEIIFFAHRLDSY